MSSEAAEKLEELPEKQFTFMTWSIDEPTQIEIKERILKAVEEDKQLQRRYQQSHNQYCDGRFLILDYSNSVGFILQKQLNIFGANDVDVIDRGESLFARLRAGDVKMLIVWYARGLEKVTQCIRDILECRDIPRIPIVVISSSDDMITQFKDIASDLYVDVMAILPPSRSGLDRIVTQALDEFAKDDTPRAAIEKLREPWRQALSHKNISMNIDQFKAIFAQAKKDPSKDFWLKTEFICFQILMRNVEAVKEMIAQLTEKYPDSMLADLLYTTVQAKLTTPAEAAIQLVQRLDKREKVSAEYFSQVAQLILRWKEKDVLGEHLENWFKRGELARGHEFFYYLGNFYQHIGDMERRKLCFKNAVMLQPLQFEYLLGLGNSYLAMKDYVGAEDMLNFALKAKNAKELECRLGLIKSYYGQRKIRVADSALQQFLKDCPDNKAALAIKKKYMDSRIA